jgi:hypothetical protein
METVATTKQEHQSRQLVNPFYSPSTIDDGDGQYKYAQYKVFAILDIHLYSLMPRSAYFSWRLLGAVETGRSGGHGRGGRPREEEPTIGGV